MTQKTILAVDDNPDVTYAVRAAFERFAPEYRVEEAHGGQACLDYLTQSRPDAILLDIMMPDVEGWSVLNALQMEDETAKIPVVVLTGKDEVVDKRNYDLIGIRDYIHKPIDPEELVKRVRRIIDTFD